MREIKFRGKNINNGEWVYGYYSVSEEIINNGGTKCNYIEWNQQFHHITEKSLRPKTYVIFSKTVGQFTGLTDMNGKEIYEGDIFLFEELTNHEYLMAEIKFKEFSWWCINENEAMLLEEMIFKNVLDGKIIGNIHDNPELLEVKGR